MKMVDIITTVYGGNAFLRGLWTSLKSVDAGVNWRWIIVDDATPKHLRDGLDDTLDQIRTAGDALVIKRPKNSGFAVSNNVGVAAGKSDYILLLNSDTYVQHDNWLKAMTNEFSHSSVGIVGARLQYFDDYPGEGRPAGKTQHAGVAFNVIGNPYHIFMGWDIDHPKVCTRREMNAVTGGCLLIRRKLYERIGGLNPVYGAGNFEDVELCLSCRQLGQKVVYTPEACVRHYSGGSNNSQTARLNNQIFHVRCKDKIEYDEWRYV